MIIAFDVKGTLEGPKGDLIKVIADTLSRESFGCKIVIWSNLTSYAYDCAKTMTFPCEPMGKMMMSDLESPDQAFDFAIEDDRSQTWLAAKNIIFVDEINDIDSVVDRIMRGKS